MSGNLTIDASLFVDGSILFSGFNDTSIYWFDVDVTGALTVKIIQ